MSNSKFIENAQDGYNGFWSGSNSQKQGFHDTMFSCWPEIRKLVEVVESMRGTGRSSIDEDLNGLLCALDALEAKAESVR